MEISLKEGREYLADRGFNLFAVASIDSLPREMWEGLRLTMPDCGRFKRLIVVASAGPRLWEAIRAAGPDPENPVNVFTAETTDTFAERYLRGGETCPLFPRGDCAVPMQKIGEWLGWVHASPIGVGIHRTFGLWLAYRFALLTTLELEETPRETGPSPCAACEEKPCIRACPAGAVKSSMHRMDSFDVRSCAGYRTSEASLCRDRCLSRLACPVGITHRYPMEMIHHAYGKSLPKMAAFLDRIGAGAKGAGAK